MPPFILPLYTLYPFFFFWFVFFKERCWWCCDFCSTSGLRSGGCQAHLNGSASARASRTAAGPTLCSGIYGIKVKLQQSGWSGWNYNASRATVFLPNCEVVQREEGGVEAAPIRLCSRRGAGGRGRTEVSYQEGRRDKERDTSGMAEGRGAGAESGT